MAALPHGTQMETHFIQHLRRRHHELGVDASPVFRLATAFNELQFAI